MKQKLPKNYRKLPKNNAKLPEITLNYLKQNVNINIYSIVF